MNSKDNKYLRLGPNAMMTPTIEPVIVGLEPFFQEAKLYATVLSGLRTEADQLRIIRDYLRKKNLHNKYPEALQGDPNQKFNWQGQDVYLWQPGWSALLNSGIIINPPIGTICLMDYINRNNINMKGKYIGPSVHFKGTAFDIGGAADGIANELQVIKKAIGKIPGIVGYVPERNNNCLHIDCK